MSEPLPISDDLETCQQQLRELLQVHEELLATCGSMRDSQQKLEQEKETLEQTIKELMDRLYGRRSERLKCSPDQLPLTLEKTIPSRSFRM